MEYEVEQILKLTNQIFSLLRIYPKNKKLERILNVVIIQYKENIWKWKINNLFLNSYLFLFLKIKIILIYFVFKVLKIQKELKKYKGNYKISVFSMPSLR